MTNPEARSACRRCLPARSGSTVHSVFRSRLIGYPLGIWLPRAYATYIGIATDNVGTIMILASIFDAITDPVMGFASDRFRTRWGRRRVWVFIGAPFLLAALVFLLNPSVGNGVFYLGGWFVFLRIGTHDGRHAVRRVGRRTVRRISHAHAHRLGARSVRAAGSDRRRAGAGARRMDPRRRNHGGAGVERLYVADRDSAAAADDSGGDARAGTAAERARRSRALRGVVGADVSQQAVPAADRDRAVHRRRRSVPQRAVAVLHAGLHRRAARRPAVSRVLRHGTRSRFRSGATSRASSASTVRWPARSCSSAPSASRSSISNTAS